MILIINNNSQNNIYLALAQDKKIISEKNIASGFFKGENLLKLTDKLLKRRKKKVKDIKAIVVNQGPGSFTSLRMTMLLANTWAYVNKIPIYGFKAEDFFNLNKILASLNNKKGKFFLEPYYGSPPKITKSN